MKRLLALIGILSLAALSQGCADSSTHGTEKDIKTTITFNVSGNSTVTVTSPLSLESTTDQKQDTAGSSVISPPIRLQLTEGGSTAAGESSNLSDIVSTLKNKLNSENVDNKKTNTDNSSGAVEKKEEVTEEKEEADDGKVYEGVEEPSDVTEYNSKVIYESYGVRNGGRQAWRIPKAGTEFGESALFVFEDGTKFLVKDTANNCRDREDTCQRDSSSEKYGFVYKPGGPYPNGEGDSDRGTSHKGVYLHAPYNNTSKKVTVYYNK